MGLKTGMGKCLIIIFSLGFSLGVTASVFSPDWLRLTAKDEQDPNQVFEGRYGPFYGQTRTCGAGGACPDWGQQEAVDLSDCESIVDAAQVSNKLCGHMATWRSVAIAIFLMIVVAGILVFMGAVCQVFTCGFCGASFDLVAMLLFWAEVALSIVAWSFAISSVNIIKEGSTIEQAGYGWGFWLFIVSGTILGAACAIVADWASENSCFRKIFRCVCCCLD